MTKTCIKECVIDGLIFVVGLDYKVEFNPMSQALIIYHPLGYTTVRKKILDTNFL